MSGYSQNRYSIKITFSNNVFFYNEYKNRKLDTKKFVPENAFDDLHLISSLTKKNQFVFLRLRIISNIFKILTH